jgi:hypothetical protein
MMTQEAVVAAAHRLDGPVHHRAGGGRVGLRQDHRPDDPVDEVQCHRRPSRQHEGAFELGDGQLTLAARQVHLGQPLQGVGLS